MSTPTGHNAFLHALELSVRTELTLAETSRPWEEAVRVPIDEWLSDPADDQRYEVVLRSLLGAVMALEDGSSAGDVPSPVKCRRASLQRRICPTGPDRALRRKVGKRCRLHGNTWFTYCG